MRFLLMTLGSLLVSIAPASAEDLLKIDNGVVSVGIDRDRGGSITWLSSKSYPKNIVNLADPGRLIQQSYYAGLRLDRTGEGQSRDWSPWSWNPIQGGGVGSWARAITFQKKSDVLVSMTIPKLWDMPDEESQSEMWQWTQFEPDFPDTIVVRCRFVSKRDENDRWRKTLSRSQEVPACYFTRNFADAKSYLGGGKWRNESHPPGPPWGKTIPPRKSMAFFDDEGQGVAVFSPASTLPWNFGPHSSGDSDDPLAGPCMHVAPIDRAKLAAKTIYSYRYWLVLGDSPSLASSLDRLWEKYAHERAEVTQP